MLLTSLVADPTGCFFRAQESTGNDSLRQQGGARDKGKSNETGSPLTQPSGKGRKEKPIKPRSYLSSLTCTNHSIWMLLLFLLYYFNIWPFVP